MNFKDYSHIVYVVEKNGEPVICIDRLIDGRRDFYTEVKLAHLLKDEKWAAFEKIAELIGKNVCIDSPKLRAMLKIDDSSDLGN